MTTTITNILVESGISLCILTCLYLLFLRKETFFLLNRIYLMVSVVFSLLLPFINFPVTGKISSFMLGEVTVTANYPNLLQTVTVYGTRITGVLEEAVSTFGFIKYTYLVGVLLFSLLLIYRLVQIGMLFLKNEHIRKEHLIIVKTDLDITPFSFFNLLFISKNDEHRAGMKEMLAHEMEHVTQGHSIDVIVMELVTILQWYNPFVWLLKRSLRENHEFLADHGALKPGTSSAAYRLLLLNATIGQQPVLANNFNYSLIKNRIQMITRIKSSKAASLKLTVGFFATMAMLIFFSQNSMSSDLPMALTTNAPNQSAQQKEKIYNTVEVMPQFPGGEQALREFIGKSVTYPDDAKKTGKQGKVIVTFVVNKAGKVVDAKIIKGAFPSLDQEALRVIGLMPEWTPGKEKGEIVSVQYTLPISFALK